MSYLLGLSTSKSIFIRNESKIRSDLKGPLSGVLADVRAQDAGRGEGLIAVHTLVGPLATVYLKHSTFVLSISPFSTSSDVFLCTFL